MTRTPKRRTAPASSPAAKALEKAVKPAEFVGQTLERALDPLTSVLKRAALQRAEARHPPVRGPRRAGPRPRPSTARPRRSPRSPCRSRPSRRSQGSSSRPAAPASTSRCATTS
ncbi:MAG: hypothetical protein WDM92_02330 [Caulobacteraceae bacterium]